MSITRRATKQRTNIREANPRVNIEWARKLPDSAQPLQLVRLSV